MTQPLHEAFPVAAHPHLRLISSSVVLEAVSVSLLPPSEVVQTQDVETPPSRPQIVAVPKLESDKMTRHRAARFIGNVMGKRVVENAEAPNLEQPIQSLCEGIHRAAQGDEDGIKLVDTNLETDMIERTLKVGHVMDPVPLTVLPGSKIMQYNQMGDAIQTNSLQLALGDEEFEPRTIAEAYNHFRDEDLHREGWYDTHSKLVISLAGKDPERFFTETMSCSLQLVSKNGDHLQLESAFVAGIAASGEERYDLEAIIVLGDMLGIDFRGKTLAEIIKTPIMIENTLIPNGVIDVVESYWDKAASQVTGKQMFFGQAKEAPCSYLEYRERCRKRTKTFRSRVVKARGQLIREAGQINTQLQAIERLHKLSAAQMVEKAIEDPSIDPRVFGAEAAVSIVQARAAAATGDAHAVKYFTKIAKSVERSISCPPPGPRKSGKSKKKGRLDLVSEYDEFDLYQLIQGEEREEKDEELEDCDFISEECPKCHDKKVKTVVRDGIYIHLEDGKVKCRSDR